jgi:hypothetical protein
MESEKWIVDSGLGVYINLTNNSEKKLIGTWEN